MSTNKRSRDNILNTRNGSLRTGTRGIVPGPVNQIEYPPSAGNPHTILGQPRSQDDPFAPKPIRIYGRK